MTARPKRDTAKAPEQIAPKLAKTRQNSPELTPEQREVALALADFLIVDLLRHPPGTV